jgi:hypothetical protein
MFLWLGLESTPLNGGTHTRTKPWKQPFARIETKSNTTKNNP